MILRPFIRYFGAKWRLAGLSVWQYLIRVTAEEILAIPDLELGQTTDDLHVCQEARWLVGFWLNVTAHVNRQPSNRMRNFGDSSSVRRLDLRGCHSDSCSESRQRGRPAPGLRWYGRVSRPDRHRGSRHRRIADETRP